MEQHTIKIDKNHEGMRLDVAIVNAELGYSRGKIRAMIGVGAVYLNRKRIKVASRLVRAGDQIDIEFDPRTLELANAVRGALPKEAIIYDELAIVAINKPPGIPSQATRQQAVFHVIPCLDDLARRLAQPHREFLLVHRLDKETSGIMLIAASTAAADFLTEEFKAKKIVKTYHAVVHGIIPWDSQVITLPLAAINAKSMVHVDAQHGRDAITHVKVLARYPHSNVTLVACEPQTGRTHQIRVHLQASGYPLVGDKKYEPTRIRELPATLRELAAQHHLLHAAAVKFRPARGLPPRSLSAPYPPNFAKFLEALQTSPLPG